MYHNFYSADRQCQDSSGTTTAVKDTETCYDAVLHAETASNIFFDSYTE